jgi:phosphoribosylaminoimidazole-succinocarboxamide synthase
VNVKQRELLYAGKAKSVYRTDAGGELLVRFRDDITAFDGAKKDCFEGKGTYNARISAFFFRYLEERGVRTHFLAMCGDGSMLVRELGMIPLEVIVRNIAAGSMVKNFPIETGTPLSPPVIVIDYKDDAKHDPMLNDDLIVALKIATPDELREIKQIALRINGILSAYLEKRGIRLVDFKIEFGKREGAILLGDEISMDSMRLWDAKTGGSLDKDVYRFEKGDVMEIYRQVAERVLAGQES